MNIGSVKLITLLLCSTILAGCVDDGAEPYAEFINKEPGRLTVEDAKSEASWHNLVIRSNNTELEVEVYTIDYITERQPLKTGLRITQKADLLIGDYLNFCHPEKQVAAEILIIDANENNLIAAQNLTQIPSCHPETNQAEPTPEPPAEEPEPVEIREPLKEISFQLTNQSITVTASHNYTWDELIFMSNGEGQVKITTTDNTYQIPLTTEPLPIEEPVQVETTFTICLDSQASVTILNDRYQELYVIPETHTQVC